MKFSRDGKFFLAGGLVGLVITLITVATLL